MKKPERKTHVSGANKSREKETVRFNLYLPKEAFEALERLQQLTGKRALAETIRSALKLYDVVQQGMEDGKDVMLVDRETKEREKLIPT